MKQHIASLDGIRGGLALWVFWGHLANAVGFSPPLLRAPSLAVDLFMLLSGFLMSWHWELDVSRQSALSGRRRLFRFWLRRFFRIAPLYYFLLLVALTVNPAFVAARETLRSAFDADPLANAALASTHGATSLVSFSNISAHFSFIYGIFPSLAANDALPDWSLSLEAQFYLLFPVLMAFCRPSRVVVFSACAVVTSLIAGQLFGVGETGTGILLMYPQPSILPLKIHIFAAGMALGWLAANDRRSLWRSHFWIAFLIPLILLPKPVSLAALVICALVLSKLRFIRFLSKILGSTPFRVSGNLSYGVYLVHYLPSCLMLAFAYRHGLLSSQSSLGRFVFAAAVLTVPVYFVAYVLYRLIEKPCIGLGRMLSGGGQQFQPLISTSETLSCIAAGAGQPK
jgi:peptidoglycan/LPS O-acetylase OafA/YrhL